MKNIIDKAYLEVIDNAIADKSLTWILRMDVLLAYLRENKKVNGGIHLTLDPNTKATNEDIAYDFCMIERERASGKLKPVQVEELGL